MTPQQLGALVAQDATRITTAISSGAAWEIWMQVELFVIVLQAGYGAAREVPYPNGQQRLDLLITESPSCYAVEMKVESATNAGNALLSALRLDVAKIQTFDAPHLAGRWVLGICYSAQARGTLAAFAAQDPLHRLYAVQGALGIIVIVV